MKIVTAEEAAALIQDESTVITAGFVAAGHAEAVTAALEERFLKEGKPTGLTLLYAAGQGDLNTKGANHFGHAGMTSRVIGGFWRTAPKCMALANANQIEAYCLPQGTIAQLFRAIAGDKPGVITRIGLNTFIDPRHDGGKLNEKTTEDLVELMEIEGEEYLRYKTFPIDVSFIRGTTADENGNITTEHEICHHDLLSVAQAAHNTGGIVIAQVKRLAKNGSLNPNLVRVPGILVDYVVVCDDEASWQTYMEEHNPAYTGEVRIPDGHHTPQPLGLRRVIQRRMHLELMSLDRPVANLGTGIPAAAGDVAREEGEMQGFTLTVESGATGGMPAPMAFGASFNAEAIIDQPAQFDFYDGGGLDIAFMGLAEADGHGNVNVSRFGDVISGVGGFVNITQSAKQVVFCGSFRAKGLEVEIGEGEIKIVKEGAVAKFVDEVQHLSFNGPYIEGLGRKVMFITERAVLEVRDGDLVVTELAPGIDVQTQVLDMADTTIKVADDLKVMDHRIFREGPMNARQAP